jgi:predicted PurR-regulated permease PerM
MGKSKKKNQDKLVKQQERKKADKKNRSDSRGSDIIPRNRLNLLVLLALILTVSFVFFKIVQVFLVPLILAATFTTLLYPFFKMILKLFGGRRGAASLVFVLLIVIFVLVPLYFMGHLVTLQAIDFYEAAETFVKTAVSEGDDGIIGTVRDWPAFEFLRVRQIDLGGLLEDGLKTGGFMITKLINRTSTGILGVIAGVFFTFYAMFYFFKDGNGIVKRIRYLSPLRDEYEERLISRFSSISRATIKGTVVIGLLQGIAGTVTFAIFGVKGWVLWGFVMVILSIIPLVGTYLVMVPVAAFKIAAGDVWQGIVIIVVAIVLNYAIDYLLRPILVGRESKMHDLLIFFSTLGGLALFGVMGFIIGPMIAMIFVTLIDIYSTEFKDLLH